MDPGRTRETNQGDLKRNKIMRVTAIACDMNISLLGKRSTTGHHSAPLSLHVVVQLQRKDTYNIKMT